MNRKVFKVSGMCCPNCVTHIQSALEKVPEIENFYVQLEEPQVSINLKEKITDNILIDTINNAGHYEVVV